MLFNAAQKPSRKKENRQYNRLAAYGVIICMGLIPSFTFSATEIGYKCDVVSNAIPFTQRRPGEFYSSSAVFTKKLDLKKGEKALILASVRSISTNKSDHVDKMLFGALLASFKSQPKPFESGAVGSKTYTISQTHRERDGWQQISPALAYNVSEYLDKYGLINLHSVYEADWTGEHWVTLMAYAATTRSIGNTEIAVASHARECDLVAIKLD